MTTQAANTEVFEPVRYAVTVPLPADRAFALFTHGYHSWWPGNHIGTAEMAEAVLEPRTGGRYYERGVDGSECEWGRVLAWEPPVRLVLAWQIDASWHYDPGLLTEVEVRFTAEGPERTRVDLEHRGLDAYGAPGAAIRRSFDSPDGWLGLLDRFAAAAHDLEAAPRRGGQGDGVTE